MEGYRLRASFLAHFHAANMHVQSPRLLAQRCYADRRCILAVYYCGLHLCLRLALPSIHITALRKPVHVYVSRQLQVLNLYLAAQQRCRLASESPPG